MSDITSLLNRWSSGDAQAINELMPAVYREMKLVANHVLRSERHKNTLQVRFRPATSRCCGSRRDGKSGS